MTRRLTTFLAGATALILAGVLSAPMARAHDHKVTIGYQTGPDPTKVPQADGVYEKATGYEISWRKFDSGAEVIAAVASGDVQIGFVGSSPLAAAASRNLPIETFLIADLIGSAEALVVRNGSGIANPADLVGKKIAVPFVSTTHYSLLAAIKHWGLTPEQVQVLNLRPPEIPAAWQRGDIDGAYVWDPALGKIKESGKVLTDSSEVAKWGSPTFDAYIVTKAFSAENPEFLAKFVKITGDSYAKYRANPKAWTVGSPEVTKTAKLTGAKPEDVPEILAGAVFPEPREQLDQGLVGATTVKAIAATSAFLAEQKKIPAVLPDYSGFVTDRFVKAALALPN